MSRLSFEKWTGAGNDFVLIEAGQVPVDPVLVMISPNQHAVVMPLAGGEFLDRHRPNNPRLAFGVDDYFLTSMRQNAAPFWKTRISNSL